MAQLQRLLAQAAILIEALFVALFVGGCGQNEQGSKAKAAPAQEPGEKPKSATTRMEKVRRPEVATPGVRATAQPSVAAEPAEKEKKETTVSVVATPTPTPPPIQDVLDALDKIPVTITDRVTTEQVESVQAAVFALEDKYMGARLLASDREQAELQERLEKLSKMAEELLTARSPEQLREKYRQLSEAVKLLDAEITQRARERAEKQNRTP